MTTAVSGIKPTGHLHLGNYLGMIRPALTLAERCERSFYFVADYHALNFLQDGGRLRELALVLYRQSDLPETFELATILAAVTPKGLMNRAHAYKAAAAANQARGRAQDEGVKLGLYTYPVLMAADILVMGGQLVPVGRDQSQHVEIARDLATSFNDAFGATLYLPSAVTEGSVEVIHGVDGRKMSKSYANTLPIFASPEERRRLVARIRTDSRPAEEPKDPDRCLVYGLYRLLAEPGEAADMRRRYAAGGVGYGEAKAELDRVLERELGPARQRFQHLRADERSLETMLAEGARAARRAAQATLARVRSAVGASTPPLQTSPRGRREDLARIRA
jgi:tryptophanyl-tRNA synthetase